MAASVPKYSSLSQTSITPLRQITQWSVKIVEICAAINIDDWTHEFSSSCTEEITNQIFKK